MKKVTIFILLLAICFPTAFAQLQSTFVKANVEVLNWEKNNSIVVQSETVKSVDRNILVENEMINIPLDYNGEAGVFFMGKEGMTTNVFEVTLTYHFDMSKYMITNQQYADMLNYALAEDLITGNYQSNVSVKNAEGFSYELLDLDGNFEGIYCQIMFQDGEFVVKDDYHNYPVIYVSWFGTAFYCNMMSRIDGLTELYDQEPNPWERSFYGEDGYRLPTEYEWEYAATYNDERDYPWGNEPATHDRANYGNEYDHSTPVDQYPLGASKLGLMDMAGNVTEFTNNYVFSYPTEPQLNPTGPDVDDRIASKGNDYDADEEVIKCYWRSGWIRQYYFMSNAYHTYAPNSASFRIIRTYSEDPSTIGSIEKKKCSVNNYPNPVGDFTTFVVSQEMKNSSSISIYNSKGELIKIFNSVNFDKGNNAFLFDATNLSPGVYLYTITTDNGLISNKFLKK